MPNSSIDFFLIMLLINVDAFDTKGNGAGSGGRLAIYSQQKYSFSGSLDTWGGSGYYHGSPGTIFIQSGIDRETHLIIDGYSRSSSNCQYYVTLTEYNIVSLLNEIKLIRNSCLRATKVCCIHYNIFICTDFKSFVSMNNK